ncbi:NAD(P)-bd dom domain-containing protein [Citrus sinensis]|nr:NAD(P)-bd dom domain-containing protein [Citrus sinensis]
MAVSFNINHHRQAFVDEVMVEPPAPVGGPKLRKWYGAPDLLPKDGSNEEDEEKEDEFPEEARDAVLVTDGDSDIGQMVILSLIVKRTRIKALVKDKRNAMESFGTYVEEGFISNAGSLKGVQHVILLSQLSVYRGSGGIQALMKGNARKLAEQDESMLMASGVPYTIIRTGVLQNTPGGKQGFQFEEGCAANGSLSKEDAAFICVEALESIPQIGLIFEVVNGEEKVSDWKKCFSRLMEKTGK